MITKQIIMDRIMRVFRGLFFSLISLFYIFPIVTLASDYFIDNIYNADQISRGQVEGFTLGSQSIWENPAGLYSVHGFSLGWYSATHMNNDSSYSNYTVGYNSPLGVVAIGYYDVSIGSIENNKLNEKDEAETLSYYDFKNSILKCSVQRSLTEQLHVGLSVTRYYYSGYRLTGVGYNSDLGVLYQLPLNGSFINTIQFSTVYKNWMDRNVLYSNSKYEKLPKSIVLSSAITFFSDMDL